jgi:hypothetical protein
MSTQKAITQHGEVEYETVKCDSCGNEVVEGEELSYVIGEIRSSSYWSHKNEYEINFNEAGFDTGNLCPHCAEARNLDIRHSNNTSSKSSNIARNIFGGIRNAHSKYFENMVENLNAEEMNSGYHDPDIVTGLLYLSVYVCVILFAIIFVIALI